MLRGMRLQACVLLACVAGCGGPTKNSPEAKPVASSTNGDAVANKAAEKPQGEVATEAGAAFRAPMVEIERHDGEVRVSVEVGRAHNKRPWSGTVQYTAEPIDITGRIEGGYIEEKNVLGSGLAFDLDGDGSTEGRLEARCDGARLIIGDVSLDPAMTIHETFASWVYRDSKGGFLGRRFGTKGATAMLYTPCSTESVVLGLGAEPFEPKSVPGPLLTVQIFAAGEPAAGPTFAVKRVAVDGKPVEAESFEFAAFEPLVDEPAWFGGYGLALPLDPNARAQSVVVDITGSVDVTSVAINEANEGFDRARSHITATKSSP